MFEGYTVVMEDFSSGVVHYLDKKKLGETSFSIIRYLDKKDCLPRKKKTGSKRRFWRFV
jgi:hypothetical protein